MAFGRLPRAGGSSKPPMSDINMTPLIDVMLVLLVVFMVAAPLMGSSSGLRLELPRSDAAAPGEAAPALVVSLAADGELRLGEERVTPDALQQRIAAVALAQPHAEVQLHADRAVPYGRVAELIGRVQQAGLQRIAFAAEPPVPAH